MTEIETIDLLLQIFEVLAIIAKQAELFECAVDGNEPVMPVLLPAEVSRKEN